MKRRGQRSSTPPSPVGNTQLAAPSLEFYCGGMLFYDGPGSDLFRMLEQLEAIEELLRARSPVKARMALILLDALTDAVVFRRLQQIYEAAEEPWFRRNMPQLSRQQRFEARQNFNRRIEIVRKPTELDRWFGDGEPFIAGPDAEILKIGHRFRNAAYHEDAHNPHVVDSITRVLFGAVARLVACTQQPGVAVGSVSRPRLERLSNWGYESGPMLELRAAADAITETFVSALAVDPCELRETFADDLEARAESLRSDVGFLAEGGMEPGKIIEGVELWSQYGADEELLELQAQFDPFVVAEAAGLKEPSQELVAQTQQALVRYRERMEELEREHKQRVSLELIDAAVATSGRLRRLRESHKILAAYYEIDRSLTELEGYVHEAVLALDRHIQQQIDLARGK